MGTPISGKRPTSQQAKDRKGQQYMEKMWITKKVLLYIEDNLDKALTLEEIAAEFQYSRFYVARKFRESTGVTLHKYIQGRRLDEAARKLAETRQPIAQIAFEAGYGSQQAFTQAFRLTHGCTPREYRQAGGFMPRQSRIRMAGGRRRFGGFYVVRSFEFAGRRMAA